MTFPPHSGAISLAWDSGRPVIASELSADLAAYPAQAITPLGLTAGLAFPAVGADGTIAVAAFYGAEPLETSERLMQTLDSMGHELGHFLELRRGQVERRGADGPRARDPAPCGRREARPRDRPAARDQPVDRQDPLREHLREARRLRPRGRGRAGAAQRA